jgi:succinoglycan biosynthesis protein ExoA
MSRATVALIIPTLNEAEHIGDLLALLSRSAPDRVAQIIVADGGSSDATRAIVARHATADPRVRLIENPQRLQAAGINRAVAGLPAEIDTIIRIDAHAHYPADFITVLLDERAKSGAESVVNHLHSVGEGCFQRAVAAASNSRFGTGGATHRIGGASSFVDHGHHALFDRAAFDRLGGYDEAFFANEDAEYDTRLRASGGRVWFTPRAPVGYYPRRTPMALARQYYRYGCGRAMTRAKHGEPLRPRQIAPAVLVALLLVSLLAGAFAPIALAVPLLYLLACAGAAMLLTLQTRHPCVLGAALALPVMHLSWGAGFLVQTLLRRAAQPSR